MPFITFQPSGITVQVESGVDLLDAVRHAGLEVDAPCGGKGICGNCAVRVTAGRVLMENKGALDQAEIEAGFVLACRSSVGEDDVVIELEERAGLETGQFDDDDFKAFLDPLLLPKLEDIEPLTRKIFLHVEPAQKADGLSDLDRLTRALQQAIKSKEICYNLPVIRQLTEALRAAHGKVTVTVGSEDPFSRVHHRSGPPLTGERTERLPFSAEEKTSSRKGLSLSQGEGSAANFASVAGEGHETDGSAAGGKIQVTAVEAGDMTPWHCGMAVDVGTTTVAVQFVDLRDGGILGTRTDYNGQLACGLDIISRIDFARRPDRREELRQRILKTINRLVRQLADHHCISPDAVSNATISGNTTMIHLLLGLNPDYIRLDPFTPTVLSVPMLSASEIGIRIAPAAPVIISPAVGSYVGGDITAGILCTDLAGSGEDVCLFMDIGTNGEVVLGNRDFLLAAACSAGPAFEGGGIKCGMRAATGAVEKVEIDPATGRAKVQTIGQARPRGICGSGMISLLAELLKTGWMDAAGKLNRSRSSEAIHIHGRRAGYSLVPAAESATRGEIVIDEPDIENIIRAKASLYAACSLMLAEVGLAFRDLMKVYIAGGFGRFLDLDAAVTIGLLPNLPRQRFHFIGNASLKGTSMVLVSRRHRLRLLEQARRMTYLELTTTPAYMDQYTAALFLPHTDPASFQ